ncbi:MAG: amidohydrolase family protein [candidate division FCPU426 bacterium]
MKRLSSLILALLLTLPTVRVFSDEALVKRLLLKINQIPYVDSHVHLAFPDPNRKANYDVLSLLNASTYVAEFTYGEDWPALKKSLAINGHHAYYRPILEAMRDLYGMGPNEELNDSNIERISKARNAAYHRPGFYDEVFRKANMVHMIDLDGGDKGQADMPSPIWHSMWNIDPSFVFIQDYDKKEKVWPIDRDQKYFKVKINNLADMEKLISTQIEAFFKRGGVGLKSTAAYFRKLDFDPAAPRGPAEKVFARVLKHESLNAKDTKLIQDYLMTCVLQACADLKKPIQFHTGNQQNWNIVENSNPLELNPLFYTGRFANARFVLLHGGYPYTKESITLARYYHPTVNLDLAWMVLYSPAAAKETLSEAIDMLDGSQLMIGTDSANLEEQYGTIKFTRRVMAEVLAEKIESGFLTEPVALQIARRILYTNAVELYGLDKK